MDHFTYFTSNISSTESKVNKYIDKTWTTSNSLATTWNPSNKLKWDFFPNFNRVNTVWLSNLNFSETYGEKTSWKLQKDAVCCFEQILEAAPYRTTTVRPLTFHLTNNWRKIGNTWLILLVE